MFEAVSFFIGEHMYNVDLIAFCGKLVKLSTPDAKTEVWIVPTNEELLIARDTLALISAQ